MPTSRSERSEGQAGSDPAGPSGVAVVGAGPAGLAATVAAADAGAAVTLIDAEAVVGGQFWRHPARGSDTGSQVVTDREVAGLHHDLRHYRRLREALAAHVAAGRVTHLPHHEVWSVRGLPPGAREDGPTSRFAVEAVTGAGRRGVTVAAHTLVLATGAYDLQVPFPGWDLPGVMTAGGVQSLLKGHAVLAGRRVVVAGTGPFLLSVASGLARSGAEVLGVVEAARPRGWLREPRGLLAARSKMLEGLGYARDLLRHKVPYRSGWTVLEAAGTDRLKRVTIAPLDRGGRPVRSRARDLHADVLAVGWGFVPQLDLPLALGCATAAGPSDLPVVVVDAEQRSTVPGVYAAGEVCGVGGAALALAEGAIAGAAAAREVGAPSADRDRDAPARRALDRRRAALREFASALARVYPVPGHWVDQVRDDTMVCRCEEVTAGAIRRAAHTDGAADARSAKLLVRPGMGWCQGRICGYATDCLAARAAGVAPAARPVERAIATPVPLGVVAVRQDPERGGTGRPERDRTGVPPDHSAM